MVITRIRLQGQYARSGVCKLSSVPARAQVGLAHRIHVDTGIKCSSCGIVDLESVQSVKRVFATRAGNMKLSGTVLDHLRQRRQRILQIMRTGNRIFANFIAQA